MLLRSSAKLHVSMATLYSGSYTDPEAKIDLASGLPEMCSAWIEKQCVVDPIDAQQGAAECERSALAAEPSRFP
jgi:hypothetical protein